MLSYYSIFISIFIGFLFGFIVANYRHAKHRTKFEDVFEITFPEQSNIPSVIYLRGGDTCEVYYTEAGKKERVEKIAVIHFHEIPK